MPAREFMVAETQTEPCPVLLLGASVRALAGSAIRAGLTPQAIDLFADADLRTQCPTTRLSGPYPEAFLEACRAAPPGPWIYTGGLENHPLLLEQIAEERPAWGIVGPALRAARCHNLLAQRLHRAGELVPWQRMNLNDPPQWGNWLLKPRRGSGGRGIRAYDPCVPLTEEEKRTCYLQEQIGGIPVSAIYLGDDRRTRLLGLTMQLVGSRYLGARMFQYAGSVGPLPMKPSLLSQLHHLGRILGQRSKLRGLFGVDGILRNNEFWTIEVNPRYTSSVEVLEFATGQPLLALHRGIFDRTAPAPRPFEPAGPCIGKAIIYAQRDLEFPASGPWSGVLTSPPPATRLAPYADIPMPGTRIEEGHPILTTLTAGLDADDCLTSLQHQVSSILETLA